MPGQLGRSTIVDRPRACGVARTVEVAAMKSQGFVGTTLSIVLAAVMGCSNSTTGGDDTGGAKTVTPPTTTTPIMGAGNAGAGSNGPAIPGGTSTSPPPALPGGSAANPPPVSAMTPPPVMTGGTAGAGAPMMMMPAAGAGAPMTPPTPHMGMTCLKPGDGSYGETGPYQVAKMDVDLGMIADGQHSGQFTIFYPNPLEADCPHPIVAWGNGTTVSGADTYAFFNQNAAAWGMVVMASWEDNTGSGAFHKAALDWLLKANEDSMSPFFHKLSTRAGVSGHSQGGFGSTAAESHPNVEAQVAVGAQGRSTAKIAALTLTGTMDIVMNPGSLVTNAQGKAFVASWDGGDHVTTETIAGYIGRDAGTMQMQRLYAAWFRCFLADDTTACKLFEGGTPDGCGICKDTGWNLLASKNM
jgi:hypothetical protein